MLVSIVPWFPAALLMWLMKALGLIVVPAALLTGADMEKLPIWGNREGIPHNLNDGFFNRFYWYAIRNGAFNLNFGAMPEKWTQYGEIDESRPGLQWRWRHAGPFSSFRIAWGKPDKDKGLNEFYIGFKLNDDTDRVKITFFQLRPWWPFALALIAWWILT